MANVKPNFKCVVSKFKWKSAYQKLVACLIEKIGRLDFSSIRYTSLEILIVQFIRMYINQLVHVPYDYLKQQKNGIDFCSVSLKRKKKFSISDDGWHATKWYLCILETMTNSYILCTHKCGKKLCDLWFFYKFAVVVFNVIGVRRFISRSIFLCRYQSLKEFSWKIVCLIIKLFHFMRQFNCFRQPISNVLCGCEYLHQK